MIGNFTQLVDYGPLWAVVIVAAIFGILYRGLRAEEHK